MTELSPAITPTKYDRDSGRAVGQVKIVECSKWKINDDAAKESPHVDYLGGGFVRKYTPIFDVYVGEEHAHIPQSAYREQRLVFIREIVLMEMVELAEHGVVEDIEVTKELQVTVESDPD